MATSFTYGGGGNTPYANRATHSLSDPLVLGDHTNAALGPGAYSDNMWYQLESLKDPAISMVLQERYQATSIFRSFVPVQVAMRGDTGALAESMTWKGVFAMEPNNDPVGTRQIWFPSNYTDTYRQSITFQHYADKVALHKYDDMVQAFLFRGQTGLIPIARTLLSESIVTHLDHKARNAFLAGPRVYYSGAKDAFGGGTGLDAADTYDLALARQIWMDLTYEDLPLAQGGEGVGTLICVTTPSVINSIISAQDGEWYEAHKYADTVRLLRYEVGMYQNVRYIANRRAVLWNCGDVTVQAVTANDYGPGDGASANLVDGVYQVGQDSGVSNVIEVDDVTGFEVNDMVTIHRTRTSAFGVTNGVDYREGNARLRRIVEIDVGGNTLSFDKPLFDEFLAGSFITKALHIHPSIFMGGPMGVIQGVGEPIGVQTPPPIDDAQAIYRFVWSGYYETQLFRPEVFRVAYSAGPVPTYGAGVNP